MKHAFATHEHRFRKPSPMTSRNIELKAHLRDLEMARRFAESISTKRLDTQEQVDTYFHCREGRLKLREINRESAQLIAYARFDDPSPKPSDYHLVQVTAPEALKAAMSAALGVRAIVRKRREIFLYNNVRIHLDDVEGLGCFLELEAVLGPEIDDAIGYAQLDDLMQKLDIRREDLLSNSYGEMVNAP